MKYDTKREFSPQEPSREEKNIPSYEKEQAAARGKRKHGECHDDVAFKVEDLNRSSKGRKVGIPTINPSVPNDENPFESSQTKLIYL